MMDRVMSVTIQLAGKRESLLTCMFERGSLCLLSRSLAMLEKRDSSHLRYVNFEAELLTRLYLLIR